MKALDKPRAVPVNCTFKIFCKWSQPGKNPASTLDPGHVILSMLVKAMQRVSFLNFVKLIQKSASNSGRELTRTFELQGTVICISYV